VLVHIYYNFDSYIFCFAITDLTGAERNFTESTERMTWNGSSVNTKFKQEMVIVLPFCKTNEALFIDEIIMGLTDD
jgi:hypothetical protein